MKRWVPIPALIAGVLSLAAFAFLGERALRAVRLSAEEGVRERLRASATTAASDAGRRISARRSSRLARGSYWSIGEDGEFLTPTAPVPLGRARIPLDAPERLAFFLREGERAEQMTKDPESAAGFYRMVTDSSAPDPIRRVAFARLAALEGRRGETDTALELWREAAAVAGESEVFLMAAAEGAVARERVIPFLIRHLGGDDRGTVWSYAERLGFGDQAEVRARREEVRTMEEIRSRLLPPPPSGEVRAIPLASGGRAFQQGLSIVVMSRQELGDLLGPDVDDGSAPGIVSVPGPPPLDDIRFTAAAEPGEVDARVRRQAALLLGAVGIAAAASALALVFLVRGVRRETELARLKSDFVANVSHELRTPLSVVRLYAETLARSRVPEGEEAEYAGVVLREADALSRLVDRVLDFSRIERGTKEYARSPGDLVALVRAAGERWPDLAVEVPPDPVPAVFERDALLTAIDNLVDNAVKHAGGDELGLRLRTEPGPFARIEVLDRGPGLTGEETDRVFERFQRGERARSGAVRGSGLGLALVRHAAEGHDGTAGYEPRAGGGSIFFIRLRTEPDREEA